jgi:hypothetical protein
MDYREVLSPKGRQVWQQAADRAGMPVIVMVTEWTRTEHVLSALCTKGTCEWGGTFTPRGEGSGLRD